MKIEPIYSINSPPGVWNTRVFIGGNYSFGSRLEDISDAVRDCEYTPIIALHFGIPPGTERHSARQLIKQCKFAIFEVSSPAGQYFEIDDAEKYSVISLCLWDAYLGTPPRISAMVQSHQIFIKNNRSYRNTRELHHLVYTFLQSLKSKLTP